MKRDVGRDLEEEVDEGEVFEVVGMTKNGRSTEG